MWSLSGWSPHIRPILHADRPNDMVSHLTRCTCVSQKLLRRSSRHIRVGDVSYTAARGGVGGGAGAHVPRTAEECHCSHPEYMLANNGQSNLAKSNIARLIMSSDTAYSCFADIFYHIRQVAARVAKLDGGTFGTPAVADGEVVGVSDGINRYLYNHSATICHRMSPTLKSCNRGWATFRQYLDSKM